MALYNKKVTLRKPNREDLEKVVEFAKLYAVHHAKTAPKNWASQETAGERFSKVFEKHITDGDAFWLFPEIDGVPVGLYYATIKETKWNLPELFYCELEIAYIIEQYRNNGIGGLCMRKLHEWAMQKNVHSIQFLTSNSNGSLESWNRMDYKCDRIVLEKAL